MARAKTDPDANVSASRSLGGNVFADLSFAAGEAAVLALRADLMGRLRLLIEERGWLQVQAAEHLGIGQSRVSDLVRSKWEKFRVQPGHAHHLGRTGGQASGASAGLSCP
jgi:predicted XRE-type DNA-binding protein